MLITLGIIGVVAALTMPSLIQHYKKQVYATRAKQAYSLLSQAIKLSEIQNGDSKYWMFEFPNEGIENTELFLKKFILPYLKGVKYCGSGLGADVLKKCGVTVSAMGQTYWIANGISVAMVPSSSLKGGIIANAQNYFSVEINVSGAKGPKEMGIDNFYFVLKPNKELIPYGGDGNFTREDMINGSKYAPYNNNIKQPIVCKQDKNSDYYRHGCTLLLMMDGWRFKDDYPVKIR